MLKILRNKNGEKNEIGDEMEDEEIRIRGGKQEIEREKKKQKRKRDKIRKEKINKKNEKKRQKRRNKKKAKENQPALRAGWSENDKNISVNN